MSAAILSIDLGSSTVKAAVVDNSGRLLGTGHGDIELRLGDDGAAEQNPEQLWQTVKHACGQAMEDSNS